MPVIKTFRANGYIEDVEEMSLPNYYPISTPVDEPAQATKDHGKHSASSTSGKNNSPTSIWKKWILYLRLRKRRN
jgi:hypothetical protein